ncbi:hypothetical protein B0H19DRAFT_1080439 [Mycena capillaripes]|nr:hypothetical protein B0H19DRAFT_1080439 [Mycena capillaripes]
MSTSQASASIASQDGPRTEANRTRRRANLPRDKLLDFDKPMLGLVWVKVTICPRTVARMGLMVCQEGQTAAQVPLYPREDMRVRLSDHKIALAEVGLEQGNGGIEVYHQDSMGNGPGWFQCSWDTPLLVSKQNNFHMPPPSRSTYRALPIFPPRITEPYSARANYEPVRLSQKKKVEKARAQHNRLVCQLKEEYEEAKSANASIAHERSRLEASEAEMMSYYRERSFYEDVYGKFIPDSKIPEWFAKINPRIAEMLIAREAAGKVDQHDHPDMVKYFAMAYDADDGLDKHFKRMASHRGTAKSLAKKCGGNAAKLAQILSKPLNFTIENPYEEGETRADFDERDFDAKLRDIKRKLEGDAAVEALPTTVLDPFPFSLSFADQLGYYDDSPPGGFGGRGRREQGK